jgi:DNA-binding CsgD family transcriptional regulator
VARARAAAELIGEVRELGARTEAGRRHAVAGLLRLVGCAIGGAVYDQGYGPGLTRGIVGATLVGFDRQIIDVFDTHYTRGSSYNPFHDAAMRHLAEARGAVFTHANGELVPRRVWDGSEWINEYVRPARVDHFLGTLRPVGPNAVMGCGFMRASGDRPFDEEDAEVLHLVHLGVGPFFETAAAHPALAPRVREVQAILLTGAGDKEIAAALRLSPHTVRQYVKTILRAHGVTSRAQVIAAATRGAAGTPGAAPSATVSTTLAAGPAPRAGR